MAEADARTDLITRLGWRAERRPTPWLHHAVAAGGGAVFALGVIVLAEEAVPDASDDPALWSALICAASVALGFVLAARADLPGALPSAAVSLVAIGIAATAGFLFFPGVQDFSDIRPFLLVTIGGWTVVWMIGPLRGRAVFLALALGTVWFWVIGEVSDAVVEAPLGVYQEEAPRGVFTYPDESSVEPADPFSDGTITEDPFVDEGLQLEEAEEPDWGAVGIASLLVAGTYWAGVALLDRRGMQGVATAAIVPATLALPFGLVMLGVELEEIVAIGVLTSAAGVLVGWSGIAGRRRFTVWFGAFVATVGVLLVAGDVTDRTIGDDDENGGVIFGVIAMAFGAAAAAGAVFLGRALGEPEHGDGS
jgi:hypothetical protein